MSHEHHHHDCCGEHDHAGACHCHEHHHEHGTKRQLTLIIATVLLLIGVVLVEKYCQLPTWQLLLIYLVPYLLIGHDTLKEAAEGIMEGDPFNEHLLMSIATLGALGIGFLPGAETQFPEAVFVMLFFQVGELCEGYAEGKSRQSIAHLMDIRPDVARVVRDGQEVEVNPAEVAVGETIVIRPGERIPLDGVVLEGTTSLNTVALTGESMPRDVAVGDEVTSGCVNQSGVIRVRTTCDAGQSTVSKIIELVEHAGEHKSRREAFITRFARIYTPIVVLAAIALAIVPPLFAPHFMDTFPTWLYRALMFLVVSCPCALVISVPLTFFGGIGGASRAGILVKGASHMDTLAALRTVVFDKTGTLTEGVFEVQAVHPEMLDEKELLHLAAHVERHSTHPVAAALREAYPEEKDDCAVSGFQEIAGKGLTATVNGKRVAVGNEKLMEAEGAQWKPCERKGTIIHVAMDGTYAGHIVISDRIKEDAAQAVDALHGNGIRQVVILSGDREETVAETAAATGADAFRAGLLPEGKVEAVSRLLPEGKLAFVGDGINDAPVLARADLGIAMGALGSEAAIEAADVVLMDDRPSKVAHAIRIARRTLRIARENVALAIGIKVLVLILAALGAAALWMAVFADVGVTVIAVLNAMRTLSPIAPNPSPSRS